MGMNNMKKFSLIFVTLISLFLSSCDDSKASKVRYILYNPEQKICILTDWFRYMNYGIDIVENDYNSYLVGYNILPYSNKTVLENEKNMLHVPEDVNCVDFNKLYGE